MYLPLLIFEVYDIAQFYLVYPLLVFYNQAFSMKTVQLFAGLFEGLRQQAAFDRFLKEIDVIYIVDIQDLRSILRYEYYLRIFLVLQHAFRYRDTVILLVHIDDDDVRSFSAAGSIKPQFFLFRKQQYFTEPVRFKLLYF